MGIDNLNILERTIDNITNLTLDQLVVDDIILGTSLSLPDGSAAVPSLTFTNDTDSGVYLAGPNQVGLSLGGSVKLLTSSTAVRPSVPLVLPVGTALLPPLTFDADLNTGIYSATGDTIQFSTNGTLRSSISTTDITNTLPILQADGSNTAPSFSFSGDTNTGLYRVSSDVLGVTCGGDVGRFTLSGTNRSLNVGSGSTTGTSIL